MNQSINELIDRPLLGLILILPRLLLLLPPSSSSWPPPEKRAVRGHEPGAARCVRQANANGALWRGEHSESEQRK